MLRLSHRWAWPALVLLGCTAARAEDDLWLVRGGRAQATIVRGAEDRFAAERLGRWLADASGARVRGVPADPDAARLPGGGCAVLLGSAASNPWVRKIGQEHGLELGAKGLTDQGYVATRLRHDGRDVLLLAGGGPDGTRHAVVDLIHWHLDRQGRGVRLGPLDTRSVPCLRYRWFWTWDHRMDWGGAGAAGAVMGGGGTYKKRPGAFLADYKRCVDFMADHKFNGLIIWGFLRDTHGGVEAAQELCRYATERGVRILPGVGTSGYAGYYFEGKHRFNAATWLAEHPELRSIGPGGKPRNAPCPSKKANQQWLDRGAEWLLKNFQVGGVNLEMGDFFVCYCDDCKKARVAIPSDEPDHYKDMASSHQVTLSTMRRLAPEAWLSYATYTGYTAEMARRRPQFAAMIPQDAICQWTLTGMARRWPDDVRPPTAHNLGYLHWCNRSTHTEDDFYLDRVREICRNAAAAGFEGLDTYGELSDERPNAEIFYLAWEAFLWNPDMTVEQFAERRLTRLYGGPEPAKTLLKIIPLVRTAKDRADPERCAKALGLAAAARAASSPDGHARWDRMMDYLKRHQRAAAEAAEKRRRQEAAARAGQKVPVATVKASDEDPQRGWTAAKAVDGNVEEPAGYWLTRRTSPKEAWLELALAQPGRIDRVAIFHQLDPRHYRSLDYTVSVRVDGRWKPVVAVRDNRQSGWVAHEFDEVTTDAVRLQITRSAYDARMGVGEIELRLAEAG